ncbi:macrophage erythroblast attacher isoform 1 [Coprinopsis sp. MPI-PUGE-AT-0042]|nr:macrophage erythroblast attacher isoform 1 [Coprinopsis sp. MPI-PUGE-AT-0042]
MATKLNTEGLLLLEQPFVRVPFENYRKVFRISQRNIEKDLGNVQNSASDLASTIQLGEEGREAYITALDNMSSKVDALKQKLFNLQETLGKPTLDVLRERLNHLATIDSNDPPSAVEFSRWADTRLDRWLVDWCLRTGKESTARLIAQDKGIETLVDIELFSDLRRIETALSEHSCTEALTWCSENKAALRKVKSTLEFELRLQEFIELCRSAKQSEAIAYMTKYLLPWQETHLSQIQQASGLFAFPAHTGCPPYKRLYDGSRWLNLVNSFRIAVYTLNSIPTEPLLHLALYAGLVALKLPACYDHATKNVDCPVCDGESGKSTQPLGLGKLAEEVPFSHHSNSTLVCRITGKIMDENNFPMALPNGRVYSRQALVEMAEKNDGIVTCPRTGDRVSMSELRKVFI